MRFERGILAINYSTLFLLIAIPIGGCADHKLAFSPRVFEAARERCRATDAYIMGSYPKTIGFHGTSEDHAQQAVCLREQLKKTDLQQIVFLGSKMHGPT